MVTEAYLEEVLQQRVDMGLKGRQSSKSHLKSALYDWRVEQQWSKDSGKVITYENKGFAFLTFTIRNPKYCVLRHLVTLEEYRGQGVGSKLMDIMYDEMRNRDYNIIRFFADIPSVGFYEKLGYKWHGKSKTGLTFSYTDINTMELVPPANRDLKRIVEFF
jgi:ribosomal protein S18 acetylase RimI-like enzyme